MREIKTIVIQLGNSDNNLSQEEWSQFVTYVRDSVDEFCEEIHFDGHSKGDSPYQNACFVGEIYTNKVDALETRLAGFAMQFRQEAIAVLIGDVYFI